jgi:hypothetical protein
MKAIPVDVYNKEGDLVRIEFVDSVGNHVIDAQWDPTDEQTSENRVKFRAWAYDHVSLNLGFEVDR